jgi:hypothetical protein
LAEIARSGNEVEARPDHVLFTSSDEAEPSIHPLCRDQIHVLREAFR